MSPLTVDTVGTVRVLTLNRPARRNAYDDQLADLLVEQLVTAGQDPAVTVIVLTGTGDRAFCAGRDLVEAGAGDAVGGPVNQPMMTIDRNLHECALETYKPTIAALNGPAVGGGCELALACDLRVAAETAYLALPEARRGMGANFASVVLPQLLPRPIAMEMLYAGRRLTVAEAMHWGLVNQVHPPEALYDATLSLATTISANAPLSLRRYAEMSRKSWGIPVAAGLRLNAGPNPYTSEDRVEGVAAFVDKREPEWRGR